MHLWALIPVGWHWGPMECRVSSLGRFTQGTVTQLLSPLWLHGSCARTLRMRHFLGQAGGAECPLQLQMRGPSCAPKAVLGLLTSSLFSSSSSASRKSSVTGSRKLMICRKKGRAREGLRAPAAAAESRLTHLKHHNKLLRTLRAWITPQLLPLWAPPHLGLQVGVQQDVAVQVDGKDVAVGPQLQENRRGEADQVALWHGMLCCCDHPHLCRQSTSHVTPRLSLFYSSTSVLRKMESLAPGMSLALDFSHCSFPQACKVYSLLTLQGFLALLWVPEHHVALIPALLPVPVPACTHFSC